jgi:chromosome partitioning protein
VAGVSIASLRQRAEGYPKLDVVPAGVDLAGAEIDLVGLERREFKLRDAIEQLQKNSSAERYDYIIIDCPPSLGLLTLNALIAADELLIPIQCEYYALEGLTQLIKIISLVTENTNPGLHISAILLTMFDGRTRLAHDVASTVRSHFPDQVLTTVIPRAVRVSEAPSYGQSVMTYDMSSPGALAYLAAARELHEKGRR